MAIGMKMGGLSSALPEKFPLYTGEYTRFGDEKKGYMELKTSGTLTFPRKKTVDVFLVAGGKPGEIGESTENGWTGWGGDGGNGGGYLILMDQIYQSKAIVSVIIGGSGQNTTFGASKAISGNGAKGAKQDFDRNPKGADGYPAFNGDFPDFQNMFFGAGGGAGEGHADRTYGGKGGGGKGGFSGSSGDDGDPGVRNTGGGGGGGGNGFGGGGGGAGIEDGGKWFGTPGDGGLGGTGIVIVRWGY